MAQNGDGPIRPAGSPGDLLERDLSARLAEKERQAQQLAHQIKTLTGTPQWAVAETLWRTRVKLIPVGSRRERWWRVCKRTVARLAPPAGGLDSPGPMRGSAPAQEVRAAPPPARVRRQRPLPDAPGLVSVVLPVYNQADLLAAAVRSVLTQSHSRLELILIDDGSSDGVESVFAEFAVDPRVRLLRQPHQGLPRALSNGFSLALGEFRTWTSADNLMQVDQLAKQVAFLRDNPDVAMVYADYIAIDESGLPIRDPSWRSLNRAPSDSHVIRLPRTTEALNVACDNFIGPCFLYRAQAGKMIGDYDPDLLGLEDYDYWMRMNSLFKIAHLGTGDALYQYRVHSNSLSGRAEYLGIGEKRDQLMRDDRGRRAAIQAPWTIRADARILGWLRGIDVGPHKVVEARAGAPPGPRDIHLVCAGSLREPWIRALPPTSTVGAWFDGAASDAPHRQYLGLRKIGTACFAEDETTLRRLALHTPRAFQARPGADLLSRVVAFANGRAHGGLRGPRAWDGPESPRVWSQPGRRLRILFQVDDFNCGGLERVVSSLAGGLDRERFEPFLLVLGRQGQAAEDARRCGVTVLTLPAEGRSMAYRALLERNEVDLVNAHYSLFGAAAASDLQIPFVQTIHNTYSWLRAEQVRCYRDNDALTSAYVCVSAAVAHYADVQLGLPVDKMVVVGNGIETEAYSRAANPEQRDRLRRKHGFGGDDFVFLNVASVCKAKGQRALVKALSQAIVSCPRMRCVFLGPMPELEEEYMSQVRQEVKGLGLERSVAFPGYREAAPYYRMADAFILPSTVEGWSLALMEALCSGLPTVASDVGAARELLSRTGGELIEPPFDPRTESDTDRIWSLWVEEDPGFIRRIAEAMRRIYAEPRPPFVTESLRRSMDLTRSISSNAELFAWLIQGGRPEAVRGWTAHCAADSGKSSGA